VKYTPSGVAGVTIADIEPQRDARGLFWRSFLQTLAHNADVVCQGSGRYQPSGEQGFRWDDPQFGINSPLPVSVNSEKDANSPLLKPVRSAAS
jgi:dTDP-4-dehydrorhamnose 3,5-epimerase-like enzyme